MPDTAQMLWVQAPRRVCNVTLLVDPEQRGVCDQTVRRFGAPPPGSTRKWTSSMAGKRSIVTPGRMRGDRTVACFREERLS